MAAAPWPAVWWKPVLLPVLSLPRPAQYTRRAFLNGKLGLTQAEAVMDLISADGRQWRAHASLLGGALAKKISAQKEALTAIQAHLAAWVEFSRRGCAGAGR